MTSETNIPNFSMVREHDHEEAGTLLILHCLDVAKRDPFSECVVFSPDTDVFLLLIHHFLELTPCTLFRTGRGNQQRNISISKFYETIGPVFTLLLDVTNGKTKSFWCLMSLMRIDIYYYHSMSVIQLNKQRIENNVCKMSAKCSHVN